MVLVQERHDITAADLLLGQCPGQPADAVVELRPVKVRLKYVIASPSGLRCAQ
jgi:hypothetical protein